MDHMDLTLNTDLSDVKGEDDPTFSSPESSMSLFARSPQSQRSHSSGVVSATASDYTATGFIPAGFTDSANYLIPATLYSNTTPSVSTQSCIPPPRRRTLPDTEHPDLSSISEGQTNSTFAAPINETPMQDFNSLLSSPEQDTRDLLDISNPLTSPHQPRSEVNKKKSTTRRRTSSTKSKTPSSLPSMENMLASSTLGPSSPQRSESPPDQLEASEALKKIVRYFSSRNDLAVEESMVLGQLRAKLKS